MGSKLWLFTGGALAAGVTIALFNIFVPSFEGRLPLSLLVVIGIWAALDLFVLLANAKRNHQLVVSIALASAVTLAFFTHWFGFAAFLLGYFGAILFLGTVLVFAALLLLRKKLRLRALALPLTMILMGACGVLLSALSARPVSPIPEQAMSTPDELKYIHETDQWDRATMYMVIDPERDRIRLRRVKALYRSGQITGPTDQYRAAMVYQHAACADDFQVAYELARAGEAGHGAPATYPPLSHLAYDRWQMALGKRQTYGTQLMPLPIKRPCPPAR